MHNGDPFTRRLCAGNIRLPRCHNVKYPLTRTATISRKEAQPGGTFILLHAIKCMSFLCVDMSGVMLRHPLVSV